MLPTMSDTLIVPPRASATRTMMIARNTSREPDEAQQILQIAPAAWDAGSRVRCTYIEIPQEPFTYGLVLSRPWWTWGGEMGANSAGVTISNEALYTRSTPGADGLIGPDLLRLGLERAATAHEALEVISALLEEYGQGGRCAIHGEQRNDNSFIIADAVEVWILETCGRTWAARQVTRPEAISNMPTITTDHEVSSEHCFEELREQRWLESDEPDDFALAITDQETTTRNDSTGRSMRAQSLLDGLKRPASTTDLMRILRDHGDDEDWRPDDVLQPSTLCMHASPADDQPRQTTASMVSVIDSHRPTHFFTGTAAPCVSLFRPVWVDAVPMGFRPLPDRYADPMSLFWRHERIHRHALKDLPVAVTLVAGEGARWEASMVRNALALSHASIGERQDFVRRTDEEADAILRGWGERFREIPAAGDLDPGWQTAWERIDLRCGLIERL